MSKADILDDLGEIINWVPPTPIESEVNDEVSNNKNKLSNKIFFDNLISYYEERKEFLRKMQCYSFEAFIETLKQWIKEWLIKLPMGTWKTRLFCELTRALNLPTIILVPRVWLVQDSYEWLVWNNWMWYLENEVCKISSNESWTSTEQLIKFLNKRDWKFQWVLVTTYQSLNTIRKNDQMLFDFLIETAWFIVSDEAHRSLWEQTQETKEQLLYEDILQEELDAEESIENEIEWKFNWKIHLLTTATPKLISESKISIWL